MNLFYDESGDLGFSFARPYLRGGSSRFLTLAFLLIPYGKTQFVKRLVKKLYERKNWGPSDELKATFLSDNDKVWFAEKTVELLMNHQDFDVFTITISKTRVQDHIRQDPNKLYNYATGLAIKNKVKAFTEVHLFPDPRAIKVRSGNSHVDYLQTVMMFDQNSAVKLIQHQVDSKDSKCIQFTDIIANIVWGYHEFGRNGAHRVLDRVISNKTLFF